MWWKTLLFTWIAVFSAMALVVPVAGTFDAVRARGCGGAPYPVRATIPDPRAGVHVGNGIAVPAVDRNGNRAMLVFPAQPDGLADGRTYVVRVWADSASRLFHVASVVSIDPLWTFPYIAGLGERARIIFFHVPTAWLSVIAFLVSLWYGVSYLRRRRGEDDALSAASAGLGLLFCLLATATGSLWAKFNWGSFWNWDPRETSIFVLLLVYGAYFALRSAVEDAGKRAVLSAVYGILAFVSVPFFIFIVPRVLPGLHPGSADDTGSGPILGGGGIDMGMRVVMYALLVGFTGLFSWMLRLADRVHRLEAERGHD
ncbi:MAG: cytochrome c biogenesis protein CcsA [Bacteroidota bacterium]|nr:cytochrome c biogenesis protein CcsA [Bacteroidota bacterium]